MGGGGGGKCMMWKSSLSAKARMKKENLCGMSTWRNAGESK